MKRKTAQLLAGAIDTAGLTEVVRRTVEVAQPEKVFL